MDPHLEIHMESALTPREIQARVRAGATVEEVALAAGVPVQRVEVFAAPILAEREFIARQARKQHVRRGAQTVPHRTLDEVVTDRLSARGVAPDSLTWDSWKLDGRKWSIHLSYDSGRSHREALFVYDQDGRFSVPQNDDARWLLGLHSASHGPQPARRRRDDPEQTLDLNDDIALVRVVQSPAVPADDWPAPPPPPAGLDEIEAIDDTDDAYAEGELEEVDGLYDIVPAPHSDMDVLYDMLSSFDEDSVQIYSGLIRPAAPPPAAPPPAAADDEPAKTDQPSLIAEPDDPQPPKPRQRRKRAQVPSWDEIVFGSPKTKG